jgi:hypothetical protein
MIPPNGGSFNFIGNSGTLTGTVLAGNICYAFSQAAGRNPRELIVLGSTTGGAALAATSAPIRVSPFTFIRGLSASGIPNGARIVAKESPVDYTVTSFSWASSVLTINISPALPVATIVGQNVTISGASIPALNGVFTATNASTNAVTVALVADPGTLTGVTGFIKPGIVDVAPNGTNDGGRGYYTLNMPVTAASAGTTAGTNAWTTQIIPSGVTHVWAQAGTGAVGELFAENVGTIVLPCNTLVSYKNLKGGSAFVADGATANTDITLLYYATLNPFGNP